MSILEFYTLRGKLRSRFSDLPDIDIIYGNILSLTLEMFMYTATATIGDLFDFIHMQISYSHT